MDNGTIKSMAKKNSSAASVSESSDKHSQQSFTTRTDRPNPKQINQNHQPSHINTTSLSFNPNQILSLTKVTES